jgi:lipoyl(octanoyl) transferase
MQPLIIRDLGQKDYQTTWDAMRAFVSTRDIHSADEIWLLEHEPIFTLGQNGKLEHVLNPGKIPVIRTDRGGQVTYHGPGQLLAYVLLDLNRLQLGVRQLVQNLEQAIIQLLDQLGIPAKTKEGAPGVYVNEAKICSIGLRIRQGYSFHGLSLNVNMDLEPFTRINPCGYTQLAMTQIHTLGGPNNIAEVKPQLIKILAPILGYTEIKFLPA